MKTTIQDLLAGKSTVVADGAMGTSLFSLGLERGMTLELWNSERPDLVQGIHRDFIQAGAQIILTNSFGGNRIRLAFHGLEDRVGELNRVAAQLARTEADSTDKLVAVAGSIGPTGSLLAPLGELTFDQARATFEEQASELIDGGVDVLWIETMSDLEEVRAAVEGCRNVVRDFPIVATMTFDTHGHTSMGVSPPDAVRGLTELDLVAIGGNCGNGPKEIEMAVEQMHIANPEIILVSKSNAGAPRIERDQPVYDATPEEMADHAIKVWNLGARIIGACCGSTPRHIQAMSSALEGDSVTP